jgi:hypothetical protein
MSENNQLGFLMGLTHGLENGKIFSCVVHPIQAIGFSVCWAA